MGLPRPRLSIPAKLLLISFVLALPPWLGLRLVRELQRLVLDAQEQALAATARRAALALSDRPGLLPQPEGTGEPDPPPQQLAVQPDDNPATPSADLGAADPAAVFGGGSGDVPDPKRSPELEALLAGLGGPHTRLWLVGPEKRVLAQAGSVAPSASGGPPSRAFARLLQAVLREPRVLTASAAASAHEVELALAGEPGTRWRATRDGGVVLSAAHPVLASGQVRAAVLVQETATDVLAARGRAFDRILGALLGVSLLGTAALVAFAGRLSFRVRRLRDAVDLLAGAARDTERAVPDAAAADELGDLARSVASLAARQREHAAYLEQVGRRLSHEMRTPVGVVRSSLDNLRLARDAEEARVYVERADEGLRRLALILSRMGEATRLEQALAAAEREVYDLVPVVRGSVEGYRSAHPGRAIELRDPGAPLRVTGSPDFLAQLLDKLVENALSFATPGSPVEVELHRYGRAGALSVRNEGPPLPQEMGGRLFESMVSIRPRAAAGEAAGKAPHLGLGLYVVRLLAEFHGGSAAAHDRPDGRGVIVTVTLPLAGDTAQG